MGVSQGLLEHEQATAMKLFLHPSYVRICHWVNALAILLMVTSGWRIYNASPIFDFLFPKSLTIGGWLGGACCGISQPCGYWPLMHSSTYQSI